MKSWIKWAIVGLIFIIIVLAVVIYFVLSKDKNNDIVTSNDLNDVEENVIIEDVSKWTDVPNISTAYSVEQCIQRFYSYGSEGNKEALYNCLDKEYISRNSVNKENVLNLLNMKKNVKFVICNVQYIENQDMTAFQVEGIDIIKEATKRYYIVKVDVVNNYFSIYPLDKSSEKVELTDTINDSKDNVFESMNLTEEQESKEYLINFKYQALYNSEDLFNKFDKRLWSSYADFKSFIDKFKFSEVLKGYRVNYSNSETEYKIIDSIGNKLIFTVKSAMDYNVRVV